MTSKVCSDSNPEERRTGRKSRTRSVQLLGAKRRLVRRKARQAVGNSGHQDMSTFDRFGVVYEGPFDRDELYNRKVLRENQTMDIKEIESQVLSLPADERASLAQRLLLSLEEIPESQFDQLWGEESLARAARADAGQSHPISAEDVARKARALLR
jgi:hypothetical protein